MTGANSNSSEFLFEIPRHVPENLVHDFDYLATEVAGDLYDWWKKLHIGPDIFFTPRHGGHWVLTRHEDIAHALENYEVFSSTQMSIPPGAHSFPSPPIMYDPPMHTDFRRLISPFFTPKSIGNLEVKARELTIALLDKFDKQGECEFVADFSYTMPIGIFMGLVELPEGDRLQLLDCAEKLVRGHTIEEQTAGFMQAYQYLGKIFAERREKPGQDMLSHLLASTVENGRHLTEYELLGIGALLLAGGLDTVAGMLSFFMLHLALHDDQRRLLAKSPELIPNAVEEMMRRYQIANIARIIVKDVVYKGVTMKAGDMVLTPTSMAGLDDRRYSDPMTVDFNRTDKRSLVFGKGPHQCVGAFLARTELKVFLTEWLKRIPEFSIKSGCTPITAPGRGNAVRFLPLIWKVTTG